MRKSIWAAVLVGTMSFGMTGLAAPEATSDERFQRLLSEDKYAEAEDVARERIEESLRVHGLSHRETVWALGDLADLYAKQRKHADAERAYRRALAAGEKALGPDHPHTAEFLIGLADACKAQERAEESELYYRRAITVQDRATATILLSLGEALCEQNKFDEAQPLLERALTIFEESLGTAAPTTRFCRDLLRDVRVGLVRREAEKTRYSDITEPQPHVLRELRSPPVDRPVSNVFGEPPVDVVDPMPLPASEE